MFVDKDDQDNLQLEKVYYPRTEIDSALVSDQPLLFSMWLLIRDHSHR